MQRTVNELVFINCTETDLKLLNYMYYLYANTQSGAAILSDEPMFYPKIKFDKFVQVKLSHMQQAYNKCVVISFVKFSSALGFLNFLSESEMKTINNNDLSLISKDFFLLESPLVFQFFSGDFLGILYYNNVLITVDQAIKLMFETQNNNGDIFIKLLQSVCTDLLLTVSHVIELRLCQMQFFSRFIF